MKASASQPFGAALVYAAAGWPVLPIGNHKVPLTTHGLLDASTEPLLIAAWWRLWPAALVALAVRPGWVVVDVDDFDGFDRLDEAGLQLPDTLTASSTRGQHLYYRTRRPMRPTVAVVPGVDMRGPGSYVIAPPSERRRWLMTGRVAFLD